MINKKTKEIDQKKTARILSLILVVVMLGTILASCSGKPSGTYGTEYFNLKFSGSKVTMTINLGIAATSVTGSFKMGKDNKTIIFEFSNDEIGIASGEHSFNQGKDGGGKFIEIDGEKYYKM